jgi:hypothetical protein
VAQSEHWSTTPQPSVVVSSKLRKFLASNARALAFFTDVLRTETHHAQTALPRVPKSTFDFMEVFAGSCVLTNVMSRQVKCAEPLDQLLGWNILNDAQYSELRSTLRRFQPRCVWFAPPCSAFSPLRKLCRPGYAPDAKSVEIMSRTASLVALVQSYRGIWAVENPQCSSAWEGPLRDLPGSSVVFHQCAFGLRTAGTQLAIKKPTRAV